MKTMIINHRGWSYPIRRPRWGCLPHASGMKVLGATKNVFGEYYFGISTNIGGCRTVGIYLNLLHFGRNDCEPVELGSLTAFLFISGLKTPVI